MKEYDDTRVDGDAQPAQPLTAADTELFTCCECGAKARGQDDIEEIPPGWYWMEDDSVRWVMCSVACLRSVVTTLEAPEAGPAVDPHAASTGKTTTREEQTVSPAPAQEQGEVWAFRYRSFQQQRAALQANKEAIARQIRYEMVGGAAFDGIHFDGEQLDYVLQALDDAVQECINRMSPSSTPAPVTPTQEGK